MESVSAETLESRAEAGDAYVFWNVWLDFTPDPMSLHTGEPPA